MKRDPVARLLGTALEANATELREVRARRAAEIVRDARGYRWVGIYDAGDARVELIGHTGPQAPAHVTAPDTQGLIGVAIRTRDSAVGDEAEKAEVAVPIMGAESGIVIGVLDVESEKGGGEADVAFLEDCALSLMPLFE